jgi:hypothetical protein
MQIETSNGQSWFLPIPLYFIDLEDIIHPTVDRFLLQIGPTLLCKLPGSGTAILDRAC